MDPVGISRSSNALPAALTGRGAIDPDYIRNTSSSPATIPSSSSLASRTYSAWADRRHTRGRGDREAAQQQFVSKRLHQGIRCPQGPPRTCANRSHADRPPSSFSCCRARNGSLCS